MRDVAVDTAMDAFCKHYKLPAVDTAEPLQTIGEQFRGPWSLHQQIREPVSQSPPPRWLPLGVADAMQ